MKKLGLVITAKQVAERSGVSISTVGRALADDPRISAETKRAVQKAAMALGYVANSAAQIMRGGSSKLVGLMLPDIRNDFYATIAAAMSQCCDDQGYQLALSIADNPDSEMRHLKELASAHVAGIVIVPTISPRRETRALIRRFPHVQLLRRISSFQTAWFGIDDEACLRTGTAHLLALGHRRIAYLGGSPALTTGAARLAGFRQAFADAGVSMNNVTEFLGQPSAEFGFAAVSELMNQKNRVTAVITGSVQITQAVLEVLSQRGISAPDDISIVGFGDAPGFSWWGNGLTTMRMPVEELATACGLWFIARLKAGSNEETRHAAISKAEFILRNSTAHVPLENTGKRHTV